MIRVTEPGNIRYSLGFDIRKANIEYENYVFEYSIFETFEYLDIR